MANDRPLETTIEEIEDATGEDRTTLGALLDSFEDRSLGLVLLVFGMLVCLPVIGALPGLPDLAALAVLLGVFHAFIGGRQHFWAPEVIRKRSVGTRTIIAALERARPAGRWIDGLVVNDRLSFLVDSRPARTAISAAAAVLALLMFALSLVPLGSLLPGIGLVLFGLALMGRDGIFALAGYVLTAGSIAALALLWDTFF